MAIIYRSTVLNAPAERVWRDLRDFNGLVNWHPNVASSRIEKNHPADKIGCVRALQLKDGDRIREKLLSLSDYDFTCMYTVLESPVEMSESVVTLRLFPVTEGNGCFIEWSAEFEGPAETTDTAAVAVGERMFEAGFDALKHRYGKR